MKIFNTFLFVIIVSMVFTACKTAENATEVITINNSKNANNASISLTKGKSFNHPTFVIWMEDLNGNYLETIFITKSYASGIFEHEMIGDSVWVKRKGVSYQPAALPYWTHKKGLINGKQLIPTPENPFVDAFTGATPKTNFVFETNLSDNLKNYRILLEVNQSWDWDKYWNNNKYLNNSAYQHSAQPSLIYAVTINNEDTTFYLNPIGHGSYDGKDGKLNTNINTITTAKQIFETLKIEVKR